ncbi:MAG: TIGR00730 family Rossman fold protein [Candidatus Magasanikiibacteriota bacterium]
MRPEEIKKMQESSSKDFSFSASQNLQDFREPWRVFRIMAEFVEGYEFLSKFKNEVTVLGSARLPEGSKYYNVAVELGKLLGQNGFTTITGGGPGIMEAANKGAYEVGGESVGINIQLPFEQRINPYVKKAAGFYYFFTRKVMLTSPANAFVYFPGGFGTMDEFFEVVDLMELHKMQKVPIVLVGKEFWQPLIDFLQQKAVKLGAVPQRDIDNWHVVETAEEAYEFIKDTKDKENICELNPRSFQCKNNLDWKIFKIMAEVVEGFEFVSTLGDNVTVLGTKAVKVDNRYYEAAYDLGKRLAIAKMATVTGGGPGTMEAVNKGAFEAGGQSVGVNMKYGFKERINPYVTKSIGFQFPFTRKLIITTPSNAFVFFPGGFGTLHQMFEILTLIETKKMKPMPIILFDHEYWEPLHKFIKQTMVHDLETVSDEDDELYQIVDSVDAMMGLVKEDKK